MEEKKKVDVKDGIKKVGWFFSSIWDWISKWKDEFYDAKKSFGKKKFIYQYFEGGKLKVWEIFAKTLEQAETYLQNDGIQYHNLSLAETENKILAFFEGLRDMGSVSRAEIGAFATSMSLLMRNEYSMLNALKETRETITNKTFRNKIDKLIENVSSWLKEKKSKYFEEFPELFDRTFISILSPADANENYWPAFQQISEQIAIQIRIDKLKRKAKSKPAGNLAVFIIVALLMLTSVFPKLKGLFKSQELPWITKTFIAISDFMVNNLLIMVAFTVAFVLMVIQVAKTPAVRKVFDSVVLKIPVVKNAVKNANMYLFANTMETLTSSWYSPLEGLKQSRQAIENSVYLEEIDKMIDLYQTWGSADNTPISDVMRATPDLWRTPTSNLIILIASWEKTTKIHEPLRREKETFLKEYEESVTLMIAVIDKVMFILIALLVATLMAAVMMPMATFDPSAAKNAVAD